jgi:hypothetical protein
VESDFALGKVRRAAPRGLAFRVHKTAYWKFRRGVYIRDMGRQFSHLLGTTGMLLTLLLWLSLLNPQKADHFVDSLAGSQHEYKIVLGAALLSTVFSFIAAIRGSKWWYVGLALSSGTLAFFTYSLSA